MTLTSKCVTILLFLLSGLCVLPCFAQTGSLALSPGSALQGGAASLNLMLVGAGTQPAGLEWRITYAAAQISAVTVDAGSALAAAGKSLSCSGSPGSYLCVASGINSNTIADGTVAVVNATLAPGVNTASLQVAGTVGASLSGTSIALAGGAATITAPQQAVLSGVSCTPGSIGPQAAAACRVTLAAAPAAGTAVSLTSSDAALTVPPTVTVAAGSTTAAFNATAGSVNSTRTAIITATLAGISKTATVTVTAPAAAALSSIQCTPGTLAAGTTGNCTVALTAAAGSGGVVVSLASSAPVLRVPAALSVAAGATSANFTASVASFTSAPTSGNSQTATITASLAGVSKSVTITIAAPAATPALASLQCTPGALTAGATSNCTVALTAAAGSGGIVVSLASSSTAINVPASLTVPAGASAAGFTASAGSVTSTRSATITARWNGISKATSITVQPQTAATSALQCTPTLLKPAATATCTVTAQPVNLVRTIPISTNNTYGLWTPKSVTLPAGASAAGFKVQAAWVYSAKVPLSVIVDNHKSTVTITVRAK